MCCPPALLDDSAELLQLAFRTEKGAELQSSVSQILIAIAGTSTNPLLCQLPRLLILYDGCEYHRK